MGKKILFVVGDGIGNQVQSLPAFVYCKKRFKEVNIAVYNSIPTWKKATKLLFSPICKEIYYSNKDIPKDKFMFQILTAPCYGSPATQIHVRNQKLLGKVKKYSEIYFNMLSVGHGFTDEDFYPSKLSGLYGRFELDQEIPDVLMHNGYSKINRSSRKIWYPKSYPKYEKLTRILQKKGYTVGSIGSEEEYINGTINITGIKLKYSVSAIKRCKLLISNDTATYHLANVVGIPNIVLFTFTDPKKNYDKRFHKFSHIVRKELPCSPCQLTDEFGSWIKKKRDCNWECRNIKTRVIIEEAQKILS